MFITESVLSLGETMKSLGIAFGLLIPKIVLAVVLFAIGYVAAGILSRMVSEFARIIGLDKMLASAGLKTALDRAHIHLHSGYFLGSIVRWFVLVVFLISSLDILGLKQVTLYLSYILSYLPIIISAGLVIVVTAVVADFARRLVMGSAKAAAFGGSQMAGKVVRLTVWVFGLFTALQMLGVPMTLFQTLFTGIVAGVSLAFGLSFGLGGRDVAAKILSKTYEDLQQK